MGGTVLFQQLGGDLVVGEAAVGPSRQGRKFIIYIDNLNNAAGAYAVVNCATVTANISLTLRDAAGGILDRQGLTLAGGQQFAEYAWQRFAAAAGFEGSLELASDQDVAAVALRFDNPGGDVFSTVPVIADAAAPTLYFPQFADGGGYRTDFILVNPSDIVATAQIEFFSNEGHPLMLPINGTPTASEPLVLQPHAIARLLSDGTSPGVAVGWAKVGASGPIAGSCIFQVRSGQRVAAEAGVGSSPAALHMAAYVESTGSARSGIAIANPNASSLTLTLILRNSSGEIAAATEITLPAHGHTSRYFDEWFPRGFGEFAGILEVTGPSPVSAVALRYDNPLQNVFSTLPVIVIGDR
jgi:hypothetical protein